MTSSRKFVLVSVATLLAIAGYVEVDDWRMRSRIEHVRRELKVGDSPEEVTRVMKSHGFEPSFNAKDHIFTAQVSLHFKRIVTLLVFMDEAGHVVRIELKQRMYV